RWKSGIISPYAGTGVGTASPGTSGDGGLALNATLNQPVGVAVDAAGNLFIADTGNEVVRRVDVHTQTISRVAGEYGEGESVGDGGSATNAHFLKPTVVTVDSNGNVFIGDHSCRVRKVDASTKTIDTYAGDPQGSKCSGGPDNVPATESAIDYPSGLAV